MVRVQTEVPSWAFISPEALIRQTTCCGENRASPEIVVSREGCRVKTTLPDVTTAWVRSLIVPVIVVVVCAWEIPVTSATIKISFFIELSPVHNHVCKALAPSCSAGDHSNRNALTQSAR